MENKRDFDSLAATWDSNPGRAALAKALSAAMLDRVPLEESMTALDYGAGTGLVTLSLAGRVGSIVAADSSAGMLSALDDKAARAGLSEVRTVHLDLETEAPLSDRFDVIVSTMTMHHVEDAARLVDSLAAMLKSGGRLAIADLDSDNGEFHSDPTGVRHNGFARADVRDYFAGAGLVEIDVATAVEFEKDVPGKGSRPFRIFLAVGRKP